MNIAYAGQIILEEIILSMSKNIRNVTGSKNLCLAGGVALNCAANGVLAKSKLFDSIYVVPAPGDDGQVLGKLFDIVLRNNIDIDLKVRTSYLGLSYDESEIDECLIKYKDIVKFETFNKKTQLFEEVSQRLEQNQVLGWYQGRSEVGPRALGNRSIIADPRNSLVRDRINSQIKRREMFRPFAPCILENFLEEYFSNGIKSPFMSFVLNSTSLANHKIPAVVHVDKTSRVQSLSKQENPLFYGLIKNFYERTGVPVLLNTSFNGKNEPIVETPEDSIKAFLSLGLDGLVLGNRFIEKIKNKF
ncbi:MAG: hypothetical protein H6500_06960 [Candidatus Woesearchaeota archaeon]|nr:MAG: hypothetical protein H6500_06960 [Candidatus Woesearchaeota archaeon]